MLHYFRSVIQHLITNIKINHPEIKHYPVVFLWLLCLPYDLNNHTKT
ncbi:hypothetical protein PROSTU_00288 [Providencia stuartii ATCC 25827]|uniref:Uncharacterized protein n=1 Tax=Providencia stuartii ATCC 25827 TaxID=471874 RepID=A0AA86YWS1_PROST|nr:hypothetical protein PROSTU_00288 [Providencia stuartii ATCC 25827]